MRRCIDLKACPVRKPPAVPSPLGPPSRERHLARPGHLFPSSAGWVLLAAAWTGFALSPVAAADSRPNIVLLVLDATRADHVGPWRSTPSVTPRLDRLVQQGVTYRNCIVAAPWTLPSMASLFTGLHPRDHRVSSANWVLPSEVRTLAELLQEAGYSTAGFSNNAWVGKATGLHRGFQEFNEMWRGLSPARTDEGAEVTNQWIENWFDTAYDRTSPFFLFALYFEPHFPYDPPPGWVERLPVPVEPSQMRRLRMWRHPREVGYVLKAPGMEVSASEFEVLRALYDAELAYVDHRIGELLDALQSRDLLENTILVVTADHGEHFGEHGFMDHKMSVYEPVLRVPLIVVWPGRLPAGLQFSELVQNVDVAPSLLSWSGVTPPSTSGRPRLGLDGRLNPPRSRAYVEFDRPTLFLDIMAKAFPGADSRRFDRALWAVRTDRHKLVQGSDGWLALFDLSEDPAEARDVRDRNPALVEGLLQDLRLFQAGQTD